MCPDPITLVHKPATMEAIDKPDLTECDASDLAQYLLKNRFQNDAMATASYLLECTAALPNAEEISAQLLGGADGEEDEVEQIEAEVESEEEAGFDFGDALIEPTIVSFTNPRGKFTMTLHENGLHCKNAKDDALAIPAGSVERVVAFPKPEDCRTAHTKVGDMILLCLKESNQEGKEEEEEKEQQYNVTFKNKTMKQICFQLPNVLPKVIDTDEDENDWMELLVTACELDPERDVARVYNPTVPLTQRSGYTFKSFNEGNTSTTTAGMPYVKCYKGVQDGSLFPMEEGLLFFKPPMYLHRSRMHSIACGRGSGGSRYVDMVVTYDKEGNGRSDEELEFSNIHRDELRVLNDYIHKVLIPAMTREAGGDKDDNSIDSDESDNTDDGDGEASSSASPTGTRSSKRKASKAAREATRAELGSPSKDTDSDEDEEEEKWESADEESIADEDMSLSGVNEEPIDEDSEDDGEYAEAEAASETESDAEDEEDDEDDEPATKKSRRK